MPDIIIIDFCITCGAQLPQGMGLLPEEEQKCSNCGQSVAARENRAQGTFSEADGNTLINHFGC